MHACLVSSAKGSGSAAFMAVFQNKKKSKELRMI